MFRVKPAYLCLPHLAHKRYFGEWSGIRPCKHFASDTSEFKRQPANAVTWKQAVKPSVRKTESNSGGKKRVHNTKYHDDMFLNNFVCTWQTKRSVNIVRDKLFGIQLLPNNMVLLSETNIILSNNKILQSILDTVETTSSTISDLYVCTVCPFHNCKKTKYPINQNTKMVSPIASSGDYFTGVL